MRRYHTLLQILSIFTMLAVWALMFYLFVDQKPKGEEYPTCFEVIAVDKEADTIELMDSMGFTWTWEGVED